MGLAHAGGSDQERVLVLVQKLQGEDGVQQSSIRNCSDLRGNEQPSALQEGV